MQLNENKKQTRNMILSEVEKLFNKYELEKYSNFDILIKKLNKGGDAKI